MLVPLHTQSHYSLGQGTASIEALIDRALSLGLPALGLTDIDNFYGQVAFHYLARERGIFPITGVEMPLPEEPGRRVPRLVLLARNRTGYENLSKAITRRKLENPGDPIQCLRDRMEGLIALTDSPMMLERILFETGIDPDSTGLLLIRPGRSLSEERELVEASRRLRSPLVADPDIVFLDRSDRLFHRLKVAIGTNRLLSEVADGPRPAGGHFPGRRECEDLFSDMPEAVLETQRIAESCDLDLRGGKPIFPRIPLPDGDTAFSHLSRIVFRALEEKYRPPDPLRRRRLEEELSIIDRLGFSEYFIVVGDIVRFARERGIEVVGRGSGAGSLVAHLLGITNVDPLAHRLYFERFLHAGRSDLPDIDIDLCWVRRDEVIDHVYRAYGHDPLHTRVAMISSHTTFQPRSALRETLKALGMPPLEVDRWSTRMPSIYPDVVSKSPLRDLLLSSPLSRGMPLDEGPFRSALPLAGRLLNQPRHLSVHPGGIVIADREIDCYVPLERAQKGIVVTQYDMHSIERVGLVKIDLLGNRCLSELQETIDLVRRGGGPDLSLADIPDADPLTLETLNSARTIGCFQLESPAMRSLLAKVPLKNIRECIAAVAIIRPGAAAGAAKDAYIRRMNGEEPARYIHPSLREVLEEQKGVVIYEEDVMCIAAAIAGMSLAEGDRLRSAIKKCSSRDEFLALKADFLQRAAANGVNAEIGAEVWREICRFSAYCFSKAHASGYGVLAYQSAYLKTHHPVEFGCALLNHHAGMYGIRTIAGELERMGVKVLPPCVNRSGARHLVEKRSIRLGLRQVKGLSDRSIESILSGRPFSSLVDLLRRTRIPHRELEALVLGGGFDFTSLNCPQLLWELESARGAARGVSGREVPGLDGPSHPSLPDYHPLVKVSHEINVLSMPVSDHPMRILRKEASRRRCSSTSEAVQWRGKVAVAGIIAATREVRTRSGGVMQFLTLEDECGLLEATLFPPVYRALAPRLSGLGPYLVEGTVEEDHRAVSLNVTHIEDFGPFVPAAL